MISAYTKWLIPMSMICIGALFSPLSASPLSEQVTTLRAEIDVLANRLERGRIAVRDELASLRAERAELQRQVRLEKVRRETLTRLLEERTKSLDDQETQMLAHLPAIQRAIEYAKAYVQATMPFKREERLRVLEKIEKDLTLTHPDLGAALTRLWRFVEEEEAMSQEVGIAEHVIELDGKRVLADVARIGMALMYFRLPSGDLGWVQQTSTGWRFEKVSASGPRAAISSVFEAFDQKRFLGFQQLLISTQMPTSSDRGLK